MEIKRYEKKKKDEYLDYSLNLYESNTSHMVGESEESLKDYNSWTKEFENLNERTVKKEPEILREYASSFEKTKPMNRFESERNLEYITFDFASGLSEGVSLEFGSSARERRLEKIKRYEKILRERIERTFELFFPVMDTERLMLLLHVLCEKEKFNSEWDKILDAAERFGPTSLVGIDTFSQEMYGWHESDPLLPNELYSVLNEPGLRGTFNPLMYGSDVKQPYESAPYESLHDLMKLVGSAELEDDEDEPSDEEEYVPPLPMEEHDLEMTYL